MQKGDVAWKNLERILNWNIGKSARRNDAWRIKKYDPYLELGTRVTIRVHDNVDT